MIPLQRRTEPLTVERQRPAGAPPPIGPRPWSARAAASVALAATLVAAAGIAVLDPPSLVVLSALASTVARVLLAAAGVLLLVLARLRPGGAHAWVGVGLLLLSGGGGVFAAVWGLTLDPALSHTVLAPLAATAVLLGLRPHGGAGAPLALVLLVPVVLFGGAVVLHAVSAPAVLPVVLGAVALAVAAARASRPGRLAHREARDLAAALVACAAASALTVAPGEASVVVRAGLSVGAAVLLLAVALDSLAAAVGHAHDTVDDLVVDVAEHERVMGRLREHLHDARSTLAGIRASNEALTRTHGSRDVSARSALQTSIHAEVTRLERLLRLQGPRVGEIDVAEIVGPVLVALRSRGLRVLFNAGPARVLVCPDAVAEILTNLLDNCLRHAPGATARVTVDVTADAVLLSVMDDGPGVAASLRARVFDVGVRGSRADEGIGLASARRLAREQGGDLRLVDGQGGCWFVLRLPAAG